LSLFRPLWIEDFLKPRPGATPRLRGLKGFEPHHVAALQDPLYSDDPIFWTLGALSAAAVGSLSIVGVQTPADDSLVVCVDHVYASSSIATFLVLDVNEGGAAPLALITDFNVFKRNRREVARTTGAERTGLLKIQDNTTNFTGQQIAAFRVPAGGSISEPVGHRLYGGEQLFVRTSGQNVDVTVSLQGRLTTKGQR